MKNKKKVIGLLVCSILFLYFLGGIVYNFAFKKDKTEEKKVGITIKDFEYILYEDDIKIYKDEFNKLKFNLESDEIDYKEYAYSISKMFIIDLYNLDNKINKYDVGGIDFVIPDARDNFRLNVENTLNKYIKDNSDGDRKQELPRVKEVTIDSDEEIKFNIGDVEYDAYKIKLSIIYDKDLEYDNKAELIIVRSDKYLYVVEKN